MEKLNITPKPWHVMRGDVLDQHGRMVAAVDSCDTDDAHLIAAAPELLEALVRMTNEYIFTRSQLNGDTEDDLADVLCIKNSRAVIAKALGK